MRPRTSKPAASKSRKRDPRRKSVAALWLFVLWTVWGAHVPLAAMASHTSPRPIRISANPTPIALLAQRPGTDPVNSQVRKAQRNGAPGLDPDRKRGSGSDPTPTPELPVFGIPAVHDQGLTGDALAAHIGSECARRGMRTAGRDPPKRG